MSHPQQMRSGMDRIRHALLFELILLAFTLVILTGLLHKPATQMGAFSILMSALAMIWNYIYNWMFDHGLVRFNQPLYPRSFRLRAFHAVCFELGLMTVSLPTTMVWMDFTLIQAFVLDFSFVLGSLLYAVIFNYAYDTVFPIPQAVS